MIFSCSQSHTACIDDGTSLPDAAISRTACLCSISA
nr:MAG TPA: hypothetical protein [Caudoviricetes sp.]